VSEETILCLKVLRMPLTLHCVFLLSDYLQMYKGFTRLGIGELFERDANIKGTRGHTIRLKKKQSAKDDRRYFFSRRVVNRWNIHCVIVRPTLSLSANSSCLKCPLLTGACLVTCKHYINFLLYILYFVFFHFLCCTGFIYARLMHLSIKLSLSLVWTRKQ